MHPPFLLWSAQTDPKHVWSGLMHSIYDRLVFFLGEFTKRWRARPSHYDVKSFPKTRGKACRHACGAPIKEVAILGARLATKHFHHFRAVHTPVNGMTV